jgi:hypothetical protein
MKIAPAICFSLATIAASSVLSVSSSYADSYRDAQSCDSGYLASDGMGCNFDKQVNRHDSAAHDRTAAGHDQSKDHTNRS